MTRSSSGSSTLSAVLLLAFFAARCGPSSEPVMSVASIHHWVIPPAGNRIPAPRAVTFGPDGTALVLDTAGRVLLLDREGRLEKQWSMPESETGNPEGICLLRDGRIAVADTHYHRMVFFNSDGRLVGTLGRFGRGPGEFIYPVSVVQDDAENLYVCEYGSNDRVQKFSKEGKFLKLFGAFGTGAAQFQRPSGMVWHGGKLYIADAINNRIQVYSDDGRFLGVLGGADRAVSLHFPYDITLGRDNTFYIAEYGAGRVTRLGLDGRLLGRFGQTGSAERELNTPWGLVACPDGRLMIADTGNRRIAVIKYD